MGIALFTVLSSTIIFAGLVESRETSDSESSTFHVMIIPKKRQAAMPSLLNIEVRPVSLFYLQPLRRSLVKLII